MSFLAKTWLILGAGIQTEHTDFEAFQMVSTYFTKSMVICTSISKFVILCFLYGYAGTTDNKLFLQDQLLKTKFW